jgi:peptidoglycan/LPS O-acetylase OafA/YrhL
MNTEFFMGILIALIAYKIPKQSSVFLIVFGTIFFLIGACVYNIGYDINLQGFNRVVLFGIPSFFIIAGVVKFELVSPKMKISSILLDLGSASYSLYLLHLPLIAAVVKVLSKLKVTNVLIVNGVLFFAIIIICMASILFFKYIEKPIIKKLNSI